MWSRFIRGGGDLEIHKPKPWHGAREFLKEYGIIVLGVLTALAAEQLVENVRWAQKLAETRAQLSIELSGDADSGLGWLAIGPCIDNQLDALNESVWAARRTGVFSPPPQAYGPSLFQFRSDAWLNARSLQVSDHFSPEETSNFSAAYFFASELKDDLLQLRQVAAGLAPLSRPLDHVTPAEADAFVSRVGQARELQSRMHLAAILMIKDTERLRAPARMEAVQKSVATMRAERGGCVSDPAMIQEVLRRPHLGLGATFQALNLAKPPLQD
ncbi:MAG: hypothetical protein JWP73_17 [Phenylobacterium sp.]|nr:hypothetical protein [Phenylobacterium sp.]